MGLWGSVIGARRFVDGVDDVDVLRSADGARGIASVLGVCEGYGDGAFREVAAALAVVFRSGLGDVDGGGDGPGSSKGRRGRLPHILSLVICGRGGLSRRGGLGRGVAAWRRRGRFAGDGGKGALQFFGGGGFELAREGRRRRGWFASCWPRGGRAECAYQGGGGGDDGGGGYGEGLDHHWAPGRGY